MTSCVRPVHIHGRYPGATKPEVKLKPHIYRGCKLITKGFLQETPIRSDSRCIGSVVHNKQGICLTKDIIIDRDTYIREKGWGVPR